MGENMTKYAVTIKVETEAKDEDEAEQKAWEYLCSCSKDDVDFIVEKQ